MQMDDFRNTHSGRIHRCKHSFIFDVRGSIQQAADFRGSQYRWKLVSQNHTWNRDIIPKDMQDISIEKRMAEL